MRKERRLREYIKLLTYLHGEALVREALGLPLQEAEETDQAAE